MKYAEEKWLASLNRRSTGSRKDFTSPKQCLKLSRHPQSIHFRPSFGTGDDMLPTYGLTPDELSCLAASGTLGWLSTDHVTWVLSQLNAMQQDTMLLPPNTIVNITNKMARKRKIFNFGTVKRLALPLNVGKEKARLSSVASTIQAIIGSLLHVRLSSDHSNESFIATRLPGNPHQYYWCGQPIHQPHSSYWNVWWYASLLWSPLHGYIAVRPYVWLEMPQLSDTNVLWYMWSHCSDKRSASGFRPIAISVLDWSLREWSSQSTTPKLTCVLPQENLNVLVCRKSCWNQ